AGPLCELFGGLLGRVEAPGPRSLPFVSRRVFAAPSRRVDASIPHRDAFQRVVSLPRIEEVRRKHRILLHVIEGKSQGAEGEDLLFRVVANLGNFACKELTERTLE